jgi:hypothetical protein
LDKTFGTWALGNLHVLGGVVAKYDGDPAYSVDDIHSLSRWIYHLWSRLQYQPWFLNIHVVLIPSHGKKYMKLLQKCTPSVSK